MNRSLFLFLLVLCTACSPTADDRQNSETAVESPAAEVRPVVDEAKLLADGREALRQKDAARARDLLRQCTEFNDQATECWWELGWAHWLLKDWQETIACWQKVKAQNPSRETLSKWLPKAEVRLADQRVLANLPSTPAECGPDFKALSAMTKALSAMIQEVGGKNLPGPLCDGGQPLGARILCAYPQYRAAHTVILGLHYYAEMNATKQMPSGYDKPLPWRSDCRDAPCVCRQLAEELTEACHLAGWDCP